MLRNGVWGRGQNERSLNTFGLSTPCDHQASTAKGVSIQPFRVFFFYLLGGCGGGNFRYYFFFLIIIQQLI